MSFMLKTFLKCIEYLWVHSIAKSVLNPLSQDKRLPSFSFLASNLPGEILVLIHILQIDGIIAFIRIIIPAHALIPARLAGSMRHMYAQDAVARGCRRVELECARAGIAVTEYLLLVFRDAVRVIEDVRLSGLKPSRACHMARI
jgi:hypothetical protein